MTLALIESDPELADRLLARITEDEENKPYEVCQEMGLSWGAFLAWCNAEPERIRKLKDALEIRAHLLGEDALRIADATFDKDDVPAAKLKVETRFRLAQAFNARVFGDKQQVEHSGSVTNLMAVLSSLPRGNEVEGEVVQEKKLVEKKEKEHESGSIAPL